MAEIVLPELGEGIEKAKVAYWHCMPGASVKAEDDAVEVATDKATFNIPAGMEGVITKIFVDVGEEIAIGAPLAEIRSEE